MARQPLRLVGASFKGRSSNLNADLTVNLYIEVSGTGKTAKAALIRTAGLQTTWDVGATCRGYHVFKGRLFVIGGGNVYELLEDGTKTLWGTIPTLTGRVGMSDNNGKIVIADGQGLFVLDLDTATIIETLVEGATPIPAAVVGYLDGYTLAVLVDSGEVLYSALLDPTTFPGLNFFQAESAIDNINSLIISHRNVNLLGTDSIEPWVDTGGADNAFERVDGGISPEGCSAPFSVALFNNSFAWVGTTPVVWWMNGYTPQVISTGAVEYALGQLDDLSTVTGFSFWEDGHQFYQINLADTSWVYDAKVQQWHERRWLNPVTGHYQRHRAEFCARVFGHNYVGDYQNGKVYRQSLDLGTDDGDPLVWLRRVSADNAGLDRISYPLVQLNMETGVGLNGRVLPETIGEITYPAVQGAAPLVGLRYSDDGGDTWGNRKYREMGQIGKTFTRVIWRRNGAGRNRVWEFSGSDPVVTVISSGFQEVA